MDVSTRPEGTEAVARRASRSGRVPDAATEGIVCHSLAIPSLAVASTTHRICASGFVHSRIAALRSRSTSACFSHRPSDAHLLLSVARHDLLARAQLFFVFGFDHPRDSANSLNTKLLRSAWESPARFVGAPCPQRIRAAAVSGGLVLALTGGAISGWVVGVRTGAGGMRSFLRRPFCGGRPGSSAPPPRRWRRSRLYGSARRQRS